MKYTCCLMRAVWWKWCCSVHTLHMRLHSASAYGRLIDAACTILQYLGSPLLLLHGEPLSSVNLTSAADTYIWKLISVMEPASAWEAASEGRLPVSCQSTVLSAVLTCDLLSWCWCSRHAYIFSATTKRAQYSAHCWWHSIPASVLKPPHLSHFFIDAIRCDCRILHLLFSSVASGNSALFRGYAVHAHWKLCSVRSHLRGWLTEERSLILLVTHTSASHLTSPLLVSSACLTSVAEMKSVYNDLVSAA